ncbi:nitroreductase family protein [soil metagenome]
MSNENYDFILGLRAIRSFEERPLADEDLTAILEAARWTGSSKNRQNWSFVVVTQPDQIEALAACGNFTGPMRAAPATIAIVQEPEGYEFDSGRVAQNIMLAAQAIGVASCPITLHRDLEAAEVLELPPGRRARYAVALGYPGDHSEPRRMGGRKPVTELVHHQTYR